MIRALPILLVLLLAGAFAPAGPAAAADLGVGAVPHRYSALPFPRSKRAQAVWAERACWNACQARCTWALPDCLKVDSQGRCLQDNDVCDRTCQSDCRTRGGPYAGLLE